MALPAALNRPGSYCTKTVNDVWTSNTTEVELIDDTGTLVATYQPKGGHHAALAKAQEHVAWLAELGGLPPGVYVLRCANARTIRAEVRVRARENV